MDIKWFASLDKGKQIVVMLIVAISTLWFSSKYHEKEIKRLNTTISTLQTENNREILRRTDSFNTIRAMDVKECEDKYARYLENELKKIQDNQKRNTQLIINNAKIIGKKK